MSLISTQASIWPEISLSGRVSSLNDLEFTCFVRSSLVTNACGESIRIKSHIQLPNTISRLNVDSLFNLVSLPNQDLFSFTVSIVSKGEREASDGVSNGFMDRNASHVLPVVHLTNISGLES